MATLIQENIKLGLLFQRLSPLSLWHEAWWPTGRHSAREGTERSTFQLRDSKKKTECHTGWSLRIGDLKAYPHSGTLPPIRPHLVIVPHPMVQAFKHKSLWKPYLFKPLPPGMFGVCLCLLSCFIFPDNMGVLRAGWVHVVKQKSTFWFQNLWLFYHPWGKRTTIAGGTEIG